MKKAIKLLVFFAVAIGVAVLAGNKPNRAGVKNAPYKTEFQQLQQTINKIAGNKDISVEKAIGNKLIIVNKSYSTKIIDIFYNNDYVASYKIGSDAVVSFDIGYKYASSYGYKIRGSYSSYISSWPYNGVLDITYK